MDENPPPQTSHLSKLVLESYQLGTYSQPFLHPYCYYIVDPPKSVCDLDQTFPFKLQSIELNLRNNLISNLYSTPGYLS